jgi:hypothetical protein
LISLLVNNKAAFLKAPLALRFWKLVADDLLERRLLILAACLSFVCWRALGIQSEPIPIELPGSVKKSVLDVNLKSFEVLEQVLALFGPQILLRSFLIEFSSNFSEYEIWVEGEFPVELFANRLAASTEFGTFLRFWEFAKLFIDEAAVDDCLARNRFSEDVASLFEILRQPSAPSSFPETERGREIGGCVFGSPRLLTEARPPDYDVVIHGLSTSAPGPAAPAKRGMVLPQQKIQHDHMKNLRRGTPSAPD